MLESAAIIFLLSISPAFVAADSPAKCMPGFEWMFNSAGQSPCDITQDLGGVCLDGQFTLGPLDPGYVYIGPTISSANNCKCSSVYYSLLCACAVCQNRGTILWSDFTPNCTSVYYQTLANPIPIGTKVPNWAYMDIAADNRFNATRARAEAGGIESTRPSTPTSTSASHSTSPTSTAAGKKKKVNAGAIAGGVIGGVVGILLIVVGIICFRRRSKSRGVVTTNINEPASTPEKDLNSPTTLPAMNYTGSTGYSPYPSPNLYQQPSPSPNTYQQQYPSPNMYQQLPPSPGSPNLYPSQAPSPNTFQAPSLNTFPQQQSPQSLAASQNLPVNYTGNTQYTAHSQDGRQYAGRPEL